jgi:hypothetical protein
MEPGNALGMEQRVSRRGNALDLAEGRGLRRLRLRAEGLEEGVVAQGHRRPEVLGIGGNVVD